MYQKHITHSLIKCWATSSFPWYNAHLRIRFVLSFFLKRIYQILFANMVQNVSLFVNPLMYMAPSEKSERIYSRCLNDCIDKLDKCEYPVWCNLLEQALACSGPWLLELPPSIGTIFVRVALLSQQVQPLSRQRERVPALRSATSRKLIY
jgi:hypothetical protein